VPYIYVMQRTSISIRELQKLTGGAIQALERPMLIKSGTTIVGQIAPIRRKTADEARAIVESYEEWQNCWTPEDWRLAEALLAERGILPE
jgi:hypothetical protein